MRSTILRANCRRRDILYSPAISVELYKRRPLLCPRPLHTTLTANCRRHHTSTSCTILSSALNFIIARADGEIPSFLCLRPSHTMLTVHCRRHHTGTSCTIPPPTSNFITDGADDSDPSCLCLRPSRAALMTDCRRHQAGTSCTIPPSASNFTIAGTCGGFSPS